MYVLKGVDVIVLKICYFFYNFNDISLPRKPNKFFFSPVLLDIFTGKKSKITILSQCCRNHLRNDAFFLSQNRIKIGNNDR